MILTRLLLPGILLLCSTAPAQLLHPASPMPSFDVVSVRPTNPNQELSNGGVSPDSYHAGRTTIEQVIAYAFGLGYDKELANAPRGLPTSTSTFKASSMTIRSPPFAS